MKLKPGPPSLSLSLSLSVTVASVSSVGTSRAARVDQPCGPRQRVYSEIMRRTMRMTEDCLT